MNRIAKTFSEMKQKNQKALVGFVTAGDPDMETSMDIILAMCENGTDILELGVPFSDPTADGPTIQQASGRSLAAGTTLEKIIGMTKRIREKTDVPIILFSYYNPIMAYGVDRFYRDAPAAGADGVLVVDLPPEESDELTRDWSADTLSFIRLIAPTTPVDRMRTIASDASGFIYLISKTGVTGSAGLDTGSIDENVARVRSVTDLPLCVGFGISEPEQAKAVARVADGVVVGSAFVKLIEENLDNPDLVSIIADKIAALKAAMTP